MKKALTLSLFAVLSLVSCQDKQEPRKIIDNQPLNATLSLDAAQATQSWFVLTEVIAENIVYFLNRLQTTIQPTFPELTWDGTQYTMPLQNAKIGSCTLGLKFYSVGDSLIYPLTGTSSTTVSYVLYSVTNGAYNNFSYTNTGSVSYATPGDQNSTRYLVGSSNYSSSQCNMAYVNVGNPGLSVSSEGIYAGQATGSGTSSSGGPTTVTLTFDVNHTAIGPFKNTSIDGQMSLNQQGEGIIATNQERIFLP